MTQSRDETIIEAFSEVMREARNDLGLTQQEMARKAGIDRSFITLLEAGKRQPTLSVIFALAKVVHKTPDELVAQTYQLWLARKT